MSIVPPTYRLFLLSALILLLVPGPAVLYIITRSVHQGYRAGLISAIGLGIGNFIQALSATAGLSVLLVSSAMLFNVVKTAGAAYLIFLGIRTLLQKNRGEHAAVSLDRPLPQVFREGIVINTLNPKVALFFLAFLPQFVDPRAGSSTWQIFFLGTSFALLGVFTDGLYAMTAGSLGSWLKRQSSYRKVERVVAGSVYLLLGFSAFFIPSGKQP